MEYKHIKPFEFINESRIFIEPHKVSKVEKDIKIFEITTDFNVPVDSSNHVTIERGTKLICFENEVFFKNDDTYIKAQFDSKFLKLNKKLFNEIDI